jgi:hypothetical protein
MTTAETPTAAIRKVHPLLYLPSPPSAAVDTLQRLMVVFFGRNRFRQTLIKRNPVCTIVHPPAHGVPDYANSARTSGTVTTTAKVRLCPPSAELA